MSLKLKKLIIRENCKYRKKLNPGTYEFLDDDSIDAFYGKNIEISVIVGKNGRKFNKYSFCWGNRC